MSIAAVRELRANYVNYSTRVHRLRGMGKAPPARLARQYLITVNAYLKVLGALQSVEDYVDWLMVSECTQEAEEILNDSAYITRAGKIPHPNGYLSEQQRAVLVLLDKLEKEET